MVRITQMTSTSIPDSRSRQAAPPADSDTCLVSAVDQRRLQGARDAELPTGVVRDAARVFKALGDPTRLVMLRALTQGELCVCELSELAGLSISAVSHQLRKLRDGGLVTFRTEGRFAHYRIADPLVADLLTSCVERMQSNRGSN